MKTIITQEEFLKAIDYERESRNNPCNIRCTRDARNVCCGCPKQKEWHSRLMKIKFDNRLLDYKDLVIYAKAVVDLEELMDKIDALSKERDKLRSRTFRLRDGLNIEGDDK